MPQSRKSNHELETRYRERLECHLREVALWSGNPSASQLDFDYLETLRVQDAGDSSYPSFYQFTLYICTSHVYLNVSRCDWDEEMRWWHRIITRVPLTLEQAERIRSLNPGRKLLRSIFGEEWR